MMNAIVVRATGDASVMQLAPIPVPVPAVGEVLIRTAVAGVNFIDVYFRTGQYPAPLPFIPGREGGGIIEAIGADVDGLKVGQRVVWQGVGGGYAEYVCVPAARVVPVPDAVSLTDATAIWLQGLTAHYLVRSVYALQPGDRCLVHAAAGGVGLLLCQMARDIGATVIGTTSSAEKAALARAAGATHVIDYTTEDVAAAVRALTDGRGVRVVYDSVGRTTFDASLLSLQPRGLLALFGQSSGAVPPFDPQLLNKRGSLFLTRPTLDAYVATREELLWRAQELFDGVAAGTLRVHVHETWPLHDAAAAHRALESRTTTGKLLLTVS
jgi:NADPH:quinone reductase